MKYIILNVDVGDLLIVISPKWQLSLLGIVVKENEKEFTLFRFLSKSLVLMRLVSSKRSSFRNSLLIIKSDGTYKKYNDINCHWYSS